MEFVWFVCSQRSSVSSGYRAITLAHAIGFIEHSLDISNNSGMETRDSHS